ncbi:hypothetical protein F5884DRAFT_441689 [Xylogone sp. PMI_703]|nr:hypothetical protein F5884DRAFT_441689 [Xylogone sp. PMI_703]
MFAGYGAEDASISSVEFGHFSSHDDKVGDSSSALVNSPGISLPISDPFPYDMDSDSSASDADALPMRSLQLHTDIMEDNSRDNTLSESDLVMYYIDSVFNIQYPFYSHISIPDRRGWLYGLLRKARPFYSDCLALSLYADAVLYSQGESDMEAKLRDSNSYSSNVLTELNKSLQSHIADLMPSQGEITTIMCIIQLLFLEVPHSLFFT